MTIGPRGNCITPTEQPLQESHVEGLSPPDRALHCPYTMPTLARRCVVAVDGVGQDCQSLTIRWMYSSLLLAKTRSSLRYVRSS